jgi:hypothetical protein
MAAEKEIALSDLTEAITRSVLRAIAGQEDFKKNMGKEDVFIVCEPLLRFGGRFILGKGQIPSIIGQGTIGD